MGICLKANNSEYSFDMGYGGFNRLRTNIAYAFDKEFGTAYDNTQLCLRDPVEYDKRLYTILADDRFKNEDVDIVDFLFAPDGHGKCGYKTCKKIYDLIKDIDFGNKIFTYAARSDGKDYEKFKLFLKECYSKRRNMVWD